MQATSVRFQSATAQQEYSFTEVFSALSHAIDLTEGQPPGHTLRTVAIGMRFAEELGLDSGERATLYYTLLLKGAGCSSNAAALAHRFGSDDRALKRELRATDWSVAAARARLVVRAAGRGRALNHRLRHLGRVAFGGRAVAEELFGVPSRMGASVAAGLGFPAEVGEAIRHTDERWDGRGHPDRLRGDAIPLAARIAAVARTLEVVLAAKGTAAALDTVLDGSGRRFDPKLGGTCQAWRHDLSWWRGLLDGDLVARVQAMEPATHRRVVDDAGLDHVIESFAGIIDAKSPFTAGHSTKVARYATGIAAGFGFDAGSVRSLRRAALLHDVGKLGVPNTILDKAAPLGAGERAIMAQHPQLTWSILRRVVAFRDFAWNAALHHERLDGSGYPWGIGAVDLDLAARILAVADVYDALTSRRAYREGLPRDRALVIIRKDLKVRYDSSVYGALCAWLER